MKVGDKITISGKIIEVMPVNSGECNLLVEANGATAWIGPTVQKLTVQEPDSESFAESTKKSAVKK